jgi:hypothetical protein
VWRRAAWAAVLIGTFFNAEVRESAGREIVWQSQNTPIEMMGLTFRKINVVKFSSAINIDDFRRRFSCCTLSIFDSERLSQLGNFAAWGNYGWTNFSRWFYSRGTFGLNGIVHDIWHWLNANIPPAVKVPRIGSPIIFKYGANMPAMQFSAQGDEFVVSAECVKNYFFIRYVGARLSNGHEALFFSFIQLPLHDRQLPIKRMVLEATYNSSYDSGTGNDYRSPSRSTGKAILGLFFLAVGLPLLNLAFYFGDTPRPQRDDRWLTWGTGFVAGLLIAQGTVLALSENWLP